MTIIRLPLTALLVLMWLLGVSPAWGHVFPDHQDPGAGSVLSTSPHMVRIWFDGQLEPVFSTIKVEDAEGHLIAKAATDAGTPDHTLLQATLPSLTPGAYKVIWNVVARDGHRTAGGYEFSFRPSP